MSITYLYGNKKPIGHRSVEAYHSCITFRMERSVMSDFSRLIDKGLIVQIKNEYGEQEFQFKRREYRVVPNDSYNSQDVLLEDNELARSLKLAIDVNGFLHRSAPSAVALASQLAGTIAHQFATPFMKRKRIVVYLLSDPTVIAHSLLRTIGLGRFSNGMTVTEFYQQYTPEAAFEALCWWLRDKDVRVDFLPHDGKKREAFTSLIGENTIEFAEMAQA